jgi:hypothetical protein
LAIGQPSQGLWGRIYLARIGGDTAKRVALQQ